MTYCQYNELLPYHVDNHDNNQWMEKLHLLFLVNIRNITSLGLLHNHLINQRTITLIANDVRRNFSATKRIWCYIKAYVIQSPITCITGLAAYICPAAKCQIPKPNTVLCIWSMCIAGMPYDIVEGKIHLYPLHYVHVLITLENRLVFGIKSITGENKRLS